MVCKNTNCKHDFCWVCLGSWEPHGSSWYNCNRYDEDEAKAARDAQERLRSSLARWVLHQKKKWHLFVSLIMNDFFLFVLSGICLITIDT
jgi:ariadne-1